MKITTKTEEIEFIGKSLYFPKKKILVFGDLHIGYEESLNEQGIFIPRSQFKETMEDLGRVFEELGDKKVNKIIVLGDLKHEFGTISSQEWREVKEILDFFKRRGRGVVLVRGNHDTILEPIAKRKELKIEDFYVNGEICFMHGNKLYGGCLNKKIKMLVLGHRHPAVVLSDKYKKEKYKCFLVGVWKGKKTIILPSFFPFIEGNEITTNYEENRLIVPEKNLRNFEAWVVGGGVYRFGRLKEIILGG